MNIATKNKKNPALHQGEKRTELNLLSVVQTWEDLLHSGAFVQHAPCMIATLQIRSGGRKTRRSFSPQPVSFNLKGKVKLFQKLLLLRFGLDPPGIRKFSFLLVMCLKMRLELFCFLALDERNRRRRGGRDEKSFTDVMQAGIQNVTHERDLAKNNHTCLYNLFKLSNYRLHNALAPFLSPLLTAAALLLTSVTTCGIALYLNGIFTWSVAFGSGCL